MQAKGKSQTYLGDNPEAEPFYNSVLGPMIDKRLKITKPDGTVFFEGEWKIIYNFYVDMEVHKLTKGMGTLDAPWQHGLLDSVLV
jgi:hypothetical protein